jgi:hypothetical protein
MPVKTALGSFSMKSEVPISGRWSSEGTLTSTSHLEDVASPESFVTRS